MFRIWTLAVGLLLGLTVGAENRILWADNPGAGSDTGEVADTEVKQRVLNWIDSYRQEQVLFHEADIVKLRKELADDTPEEAMRWWKQTEKMRAALESPEWKETRNWFREFLKVQAIFSDEQIDSLRDKATEAAEQRETKEFTDILFEIERYRVNLVQGSADARAVRQQRLELLQAYKKDAADQRAEAAKAAAFGTINASPPPAPRGQRLPRQASAPLINSLDVARWSVMRNFWRY